MTISFFLFIAVLVVLLLWSWRGLSSDKYLWQRDNSYPSRVVVVVAYLFLGICATFTLNKYIYPKDQSVYGNAKYHVIRHKGFRFNSLLTLVAKSDYVDDVNSALWDSKVGDVTLSHEQIKVYDYPEPFYFKADSVEFYSLHNRPFEKDIADTLTIAIGDKKLFQLTMREQDKRVEYTFEKPSSKEKYVSNFTKKIKKGYPLLDIIVQTPNFTVDTVDNIDINTLLEGTYLVRTDIYADKDKLVDSSKMVLFPGRDLLIVDNLRVNDELCDPNPEREDIKVGKGVSFFSGLGNKRTSIYTLRPNAKDSTTMELFYALPKMYSLRDSVSNRVFLTSSVAGVLENADMGGYYFNILDNEENQNHINGQLRYKTGNAREPLSFEVFDFYSDNPTNKKSLAAGDEFELNIRGGEVSKKTNGQRDEKIGIYKDVKWVFDVEDLRATNPMQWNDIFIYLAIFLALVCLRILWDSHSSNPSLSFFEITAYVVVFAFLVVRLILGWRSSTFVPTDGVTVAVFNKMRENIIDYNLLKLSNIRTYIPFLFPVVMMLRGGVSKLYYRIIESETWYNLSNKRSRNTTETSQSGGEGKVVSTIRRLVSFSGLNEVYDYIKLRFADKKGYLLLAYVVLLAVACVLSTKLIPSFERIFNIPLPIISYLLVDRWLSKRDDSILVRVLAALFAFGYIFLVDAGFSIVLVVYHLFMWLIIEPVFSVESLWRRVGCCIGGVVTIFVALCFEGDMMMWIFENVKLFLGIVFTVITLLTTACLWRSDEVSGKAVTGWATICTVTFVAVMLLFSGTITNMVQKKEHMKYRAEIQKLDEGEQVDKLMINCDFDSSNITYIMRSAHNQWFINQYLKAGRNAEAKDRYFTIQPHSKQGSTYTTQTTDLVVTRYVLAEHSRWVVVWLLVLLGMLVVMFFVEGAMDKQKNRVMLGGILLLFLLALLVYLSATNRIVFIGQDFPFLSIQSLVAVLLPISLITMAALSLSNDCSNTDNDDQTTSGNKIFLGISLFVITVAVIFIPKNGSEIKDNQFDVSAIYATLSEKVRILDKQMRLFQGGDENKDERAKSKDDFWESFKRSEYYKKGIEEFTNAEDQFSKTLLDYFENKQPNKNDPDKLLHLKRRNGRWTMAVNKKHYFIPSMIDKAHQWQGNLYAANVGCDLLILNANNDKVLDRQIVDNEKEREINNQNILETYEDITKIAGKINMFNVSVTRFDKEWSADQQPIVLLSSTSGGRTSNSQQAFNIETPEISILGTGNIEQAAMRVHLGDYVVLNQGYVDEREQVSTWRYTSEPERHLARNVWINGRQKLFYPLGKESMWSYQFANTVSRVFAKSDTTRYQDLRTSIDYDLMADFYKFFEKDNRSELNISQSIKENLVNFQNLDYNQMQNKNNRTKFYYDRDKNMVKYNGQARNIDNILARINHNLSNTEKAEKKDAIKDAVSKSLEKSYSFSAVALDGNGRIRLLFDHNKHRNVDPNNSRHINELISDLYKDGSVGEENDVFGCKALLTMESGPGSTFKPVVYTAVTSQKKINWQNMSIVYADKMPRRELTEEEKNQGKSQSQRPVLAYGGIACTDAGGNSLNIDNERATINSSEYLTRSNNLFHSLVVMLGLQSDTQFGKVMRPLTAAEKQRRGTGVDTLLHPIFNLDGTLRTLNPQVWFGDEGERFIKKNEATILSTGLNDNFQIGSFADNKYQNVFGKGDAIFDLLYKEAGNYSCWTYPQACAIGVADMGKASKMDSFNQLLLGANPLEMTPLAMCEAVMRLATLNSAENLTTLSDTVTEVRDVKPFTYDDNWEGEDRYFNFYKTEVLSQLKKVPTSGTAADLRSSIRGNYHIYAKTGTLDVERNAGERMKHLIVIIAKRPLEEATSVAELRKIKYYALYLSYMNIKLDIWNDANAVNEQKNQRFASLINKVIESETFKDYMKD